MISQGHLKIMLASHLQNMKTSCTLNNGATGLSLLKQENYDVFCYLKICGKTQKENPGNDMFPGFVVDNNYLFEDFPLPEKPYFTGFSLFFVTCALFA